MLARLVAETGDTVDEATWPSKESALVQAAARAEVWGVAKRKPVSTSL